VKEFIKKDEVKRGILYDNSDIPEDILIENNESMVGIYLCIYNDEKYENFMSSIKNAISDENGKVLNEVYYEWPIENYSELNETLNYSEYFDVGGYNWQIELNNESDEDIKNKYCVIILKAAFQQNLLI